MSVDKKEEEQLLEAMKAMKNVDWKKVIKVLAKIQQTEGKDDGELNKLLDKWEDVYDDVFKEPLKCSFCNKTQNEVRKLIAGSGDISVMNVLSCAARYWMRNSKEIIIIVP